MLLVSPSVTHRIAQDSLRAYPQECCGLLLGQETSAERIIFTAVTCQNTAAAKRVAFRISSKEYIRVESYASENKLQVLGVFHSHPDSAAVPSFTDTAGALPNFSYLIVSVKKQSIAEMRSWRLSNERLFWEEEIRI